MGMEFYGDDFQGADVAPFVGINTFMHLPWIKTHKELLEAKPDVAIIGEPFDFGTTIRPGARYGPRAIRAASPIIATSGFASSNSLCVFIQGRCKNVLIPTNGATSAP